MVKHPFNLCVFSFLFVFTYDTLRDVSGDMHHPRHRFITAVGTRTTRTNPRSFLVFARHNCLSVCLCLSLCLSVFLSSFPSPDFFSLFVYCLFFSLCVCLSGSLSEHLSAPLSLYSVCLSIYLSDCLNFLLPLCLSPIGFLSAFQFLHIMIYLVYFGIHRETTGADFH